MHRMVGGVSSHVERWKKDTAYEVKFSTTSTYHPPSLKALWVWRQGRPVA